MKSDEFRQQYNVNDPTSVNQFAKDAICADNFTLFLRKHRTFWNEVKESIKSTTKYSREKIYLILHNFEIPKCPVCGSNVTWDHRRDHYHQFCSSTCSNRSKVKKERIRITNMQRYGQAHPMKSKKVQQKVSETMMKRYGVKRPMQHTNFKRKIMETNQRRYGKNWPAQNEEILDKIRLTNTKKYGVEWAPQHPDIKRKQLLTLQEHYGVTVPVHNPDVYAKCISRINETNISRGCYTSQQHIPREILEKLQDYDFLYHEHIEKKKSISLIAKELGISTTPVTSGLQKQGIPIQNHFTSTGHFEIITFLEDLGISNVITNTRKIIPPYELDIFLPDYNLAIEYNGLYWHSEIHKKSNYHLQKTVMCEQKRIRLIHIFEDEWRDQQQKCKDTLCHLLGKSSPGTFARNTYIKEIPWKQARDFLNKHHLLGAGSSGNYRIGAFDKHTDELIGVMVFGRSTSEGSNEIELKRFVTNKKNNPGLGSKMFKYAVNKQGYQEVIAFVDRRWFTGLVKDHIGFQRIYETKPAVWWTDGINRYHRRFKHKKQLITESQDEVLSKRTLLQKAGFVRIWDCGKVKLQWKND